MHDKQSKKRMTKVIWTLCALIILAVFGIPKLYSNYHAAPYYHISGQQITLESKNTHKLNKYQKQQFTKIAKNAVDKQSGPFVWENYRTVSLKVYKMKKPSEYGLIYQISPRMANQNRTITSSVIVKLSHRDLKRYEDVSIKGYSSDFF